MLLDKKVLPVDDATVTAQHSNEDNEDADNNFGGRTSHFPVFLDIAFLYLLILGIIAFVKPRCSFAVACNREDASGGVYFEGIFIFLEALAVISALVHRRTFAEIVGSIVAALMTLVV